MSLDLSRAVAVVAVPRTTEPPEIQRKDLLLQVAYCRVAVSNAPAAGGRGEGPLVVIALPGGRTVQVPI